MRNLIGKKAQGRKHPDLHPIHTQMCSYHPCPDAPSLAACQLSCWLKIAILVYIALHWMVPGYIMELLLERPNCSKTRAKTFGDRAFVHATLSIWNMLPYGIRNSETIECFKSQVKTFLFKTAFDSNFKIYRYFYLKHSNFIFLTCLSCLHIRSKESECCKALWN